MCRARGPSAARDIFRTPNRREEAAHAYGAGWNAERWTGAGCWTGAGMLDTAGGSTLVGRLDSTLPVDAGHVKRTLHKTLAATEDAGCCRDA